jgi:hypothetical protein
MAATAAQVVAETREEREARSRWERGFAKTAGECWLGWFEIGSPSETKGISRTRDTGKSIDSKWATQTAPKSPSPFWNV